jgi:hypothetical protein
MALRIKSAMTALLFCEPNTLSNSALMSSGTLKFTVAIPRAYAIVEIFNNAMVPRNAWPSTLMPDKTATCLVVTNWFS